MRAFAFERAASGERGNLLSAWREIFPAGALRVPKTSNVWAFRPIFPSGSVWMVEPAPTTMEPMASILSEVEASSNPLASRLKLAGDRTPSGKVLGSNAICPLRLEFLEYPSVAATGWMEVSGATSTVGFSEPAKLTPTKEKSVNPPCVKKSGDNTRRVP